MFYKSFGKFNVFNGGSFNDVVVGGCKSIIQPSSRWVKGQIQHRKCVCNFYIQNVFVPQ